jgi:hypothetical protein
MCSAVNHGDVTLAWHYVSLICAMQTIEGWAVEESVFPVGFV